MKHPWFRKTGWLYYPLSWEAWILTILGVAFCVHIYLLADTHSSSSDALYVLYPYALTTFLFWAWIAEKKSR